MSAIFHKINYFITRACNYKCEFCSVRQKQTKFSDDETLKKIARFLLGIYDVCNLNYDTYQVVITGGEPTVHPLFKNFVYYMKDAEFEIKLNSNLSGNIETYKYMIDTLKYPRFQLTFHNHHIKYEEFLAKITELINYSNGICRFSITYNLDDNRLTADEIYKMFGHLCGRKVYIMLNTINRDNSARNAELDYNDFTDTEFLLNKMNNKYGKMTNCHITNATLSENGLLYHCGHIPNNLPILNCLRDNSANVYKALENVKFMCKYYGVCCYNLDEIDNTRCFKKK